MTLSEVLHNYGSPIYVEIGTLIFVWSGGPYIDIHVRESEGSVSISDVNINVWDYGTDKATIPFTAEALINEAMEWMFPE